MNTVYGIPYIINELFIHISVPVYLQHCTSELQRHSNKVYLRLPCPNIINNPPEALNTGKKSGKCKNLHSQSTSVPLNIMQNTGPGFGSNKYS